MAFFLFPTRRSLGREACFGAHAHETGHLCSDPFREEMDAEKKAEEAKKAAEEKKERDKEEIGTWFSNPAGAAAQAGVAGAAPAPQRAGVGKYLAASLLRQQQGAEEAAAGPAKKQKTGGFGNFDNW